MVVSDLYVSLTIGMFLSLISVELLGLASAGIIVPGYLALSFDQPLIIVIVFIISFLTYIIVTKVLSKFMIIYGKRKFVAMIFVALILKLLIDIINPVFLPQALEIRGIGAVVPGIIANCIEKQGWLITVTGTFTLSGITFLLLTVSKLV